MSPPLGASTQRTEDPMVYRTSLAGPSVDTTRSMRVCAPNAAWLRLEFGRLRLDGDDTLTVISDRGERHAFGNGYRNDASFELRSLRGACVELEPRFADPDSAYRLDAYRYASFELTESAVVVAGAGDVCDTAGDGCRRTSDTMLSIAPNAAFVLGDNAYLNGALSDYNERYEPAWGRFKTSTKPAPGNHEYLTPNAAGYFDYFNGIGAQTGIAGERGKGYYSWNIGEWHFVVLNSNFAPTDAASAQQLSWLRADLAANTMPCTAAYFHHPMVNVGRHAGTPEVKPFW
ncbi:MAG: metallophosphoesterase, partial [Xanthomonadaceae bacterium]|nr:metallophosphoesterase [Xanthomonadaceae bacterium]